MKSHLSFRTHYGKVADLLVTSVTAKALVNVYQHQSPLRTGLTLDHQIHFTQKKRKTPILKINGVRVPSINVINLSKALPR